MKMKWTAVLAVSTAVSATIAGPGSLLQSVSATASSSTPTITLRFATWDTVGHADLVKLFEKQNPNIKVQWEHVNGDFDTKLLTELAAGDAPDVFEVDNPAMYAMKGAIDDLSTTFMKTDKSFNTNAYYQGVLDQGMYAGQLYVLPKDYSDFAVFYNKKMFAQAHVPIPKAGWTWAQLYQDAQKLTVRKNGKVVQWGALMPTDWDFQYDSMVQAWGGNVTDPMGKTTKGHLDGQPAVKAMKYLLDFYAQGLTPSLEYVNSLKNVDLFASQKAAMTITGTWFVGNWRKTPGLQFGAVGMPKGTSQANFVVSAGFGINKSSPNQAAAWKFLKFVGGYEGSMHYGYYALPSMPKAAVALKMTKDPIFNLFLTQMKEVKVLPVTQDPYWGSTAGPIMTNMLDKLENQAAQTHQVSTASIQTTLTQTADQIQQQLAQKYAGN